jgi:NAD+ synthase (glutamine-hydrolysing)
MHTEVDLMQNHGFFRIMAVSPELFPGDPVKNSESVCAAMNAAKEKEAALIVFPELCLSGASCGDLFLMHTLLSETEAALLKTAEITKNSDIACVVPLPLEKDGKIYTAAAFTAGGEILGVVPLPGNSNVTGSVFSEYQGEDSYVVIDGRSVPFGRNLVFRLSDSADLSIAIGKGDILYPEASLYIYPDAALASVGSRHNTLRSCEEISRSSCCAVVYCCAGNGESTGSGVFSGQCVIAEDGTVLSEAEPFGSGTAFADVDLQAIAYRKRSRRLKNGCRSVTYVPFSLKDKELSMINREITKLPFLGDPAELEERCRTSFEIQSRGLAGRMGKIGSRKAVLGVSGGLDSTLALLVSIRAIELLGKTKKDVIAVSMPCFGTSDRTRTNAQILCEELGVDFRIVDISKSVSQHLSDIGHDLVTVDTAYENAQARERTQVLMDLANMENGIVVGTGDMSESALGWCTFNGDHMSMYNVNCSMPKTLIRALVSYHADRCGNETVEKVLRDIVATPISPELKPAVEGEIAQKTEEIIGPYDVHDFILYHFIKSGSGPAKALYLASIAFRADYDGEQLERWVGEFFRRFFRSQFKRSCAPDGPVVGSLNLSASGWSMPSDISGERFMSLSD